VPFFLGPGFAMATGRGEIVRALRAIPASRALRLLVVVPDVAIATGMVYSNHLIPKSRLTGFGHVATLVQLRAESYARDRVKPRLINDLERGVRARFAAVPEALRDLRHAGARQVRMSGSGSAVFGHLPDPLSPRAVADSLRSRYSRVFVVRSVRAGSRPCR
jgi:4-diphosphocytidyl-2C-methyl-D-erythritol kinase